MDTPAPDDWPALLAFVRDWIFAPVVIGFGFLWREIGQVKREQAEQLDRIELSVAKIAAAFGEHALDDLRRFASKEDLSVLRNDVLQLRQHIDERFDRLPSQINGTKR